MANKYVYGLTALKVGAPEADGGMSLALSVLFGDTVPGSASITTADPTITNINIEESDDAIISSSTPGARTVAFSTYNTSPAALLGAFGGTLTGTAPNQVWNAPENVGDKILSIRFEDRQNRFVNLPKVALNPKLGIVFDKTQAGKVDFTGTILKPDKAGVSAIQVGPIS
jgi:hypothetical protein